MFRTVDGLRVCLPLLVVQSGGVQVSVSDDREYRYFVLDNQLRVIVATDPSTEKVLTVWYDPPLPLATFRPPPQAPSVFAGDRLVLPYPLTLVATVIPSSCLASRTFWR